MPVLVSGLILFLGVHCVRIFAPDWRLRRIAAMGEAKWKGLYSLASLAGLVLLVWGYALARQEAAILYEPATWLRHVAALLMVLALISFAAYLLPAGRLKPVLKHPMLVSVKAWALAHLLANGDLASIMLFGAFLAWAVAARISAKRRNAPVPQLGPVVYDVAAVALGLVLYTLFVWRLHAWLFGVAPLG